MQAHAVFIGGISGAGKTTLCHRLAYNLGGIVVRQHHLVIEVGRRSGLNKWEEIGLLYDKFIERAAKFAINHLKSNKGNLLLIDSHFSIRTTKALRARNKNINDEYIPDLDKFFVSTIKEHAKISLILLAVQPEIAIRRFNGRRANLLDYDNTLVGLIKSDRMERDFYLKLIDDLKLNPQNCLIVDNNRIIDNALSEITSFITKLP